MPSSNDIMPEDVQALVDEAREYAREGSLPAPAHAYVLALIDALEAERGHIQSLAKWVGVDEATPSLEIACEVSAALEAAQRPLISQGVLNEYREVAKWLDGKAAVLTPVGDTMHALAAEALHVLVQREEDRWVSGDDPIPRYAQLDVWMALFGAERSEEYEPLREEHGFAEAWSWLLAQIRAQRPPASREVREALARVVREATAEYLREDLPEDGRDETDTIVDAILARFSFPSQPVYDEEMVERVAKALLVADVPGTFTIDDWDLLSDAGRDEFRRCARAALEAAYSQSECGDYPAPCKHDPAHQKGTE